MEKIFDSNETFMIKAEHYSYSPEILKDRQADPSHNVFGYGIFLYEMFSDISKCYGRQLNIYEYYLNISEYSRPFLMKNIPDHYWELIERCMDKYPLKRPTFEEITEILKDDKFALEENGIKTNLDDLHEYQKRVDSQDLSHNPFIGSDDEIYHQVINKIGEGATSVTYKVIDNRTDEVMCKKILKNNTNQPLTFADLQQFTKQFDILFVLRHPCICRVIGINLHEIIVDPNINININSNEQEISTVSIFLEYEEYKLIDILNKLNISNTLKVKIAIEIAHAMKFIHQNGLIYRDLKIENIMLNSVFETKLVDFGLVRIHECLNPDFSFVSSSMTKGVGTFAYMSPEMLNEENYDYKTDVYSYGVVLYYIFVENLPKQNLKDKLLGKEIPLPHPSPSISQYCIELISKCMKSDPTERPTFDDILTDMRNHSYLLATNIDYNIVHNRNKELSLYEIKSSK